MTIMLIDRAFGYQIRHKCYTTPNQYYQRYAWALRTHQAYLDDPSPGLVKFNLTVYV